MTLPWWRTTDIVEHESELSLQRANSALDWLAEQKRLRREQAEQEALRTGRLNATLATNFALARQRASAADEIDEANRRLQELGVQKRISMSESSIGQQIISGRTYANQYVSAAEAETRQVRLKEIRKEAEQWAKWSIRGEGANWADLNPDEQERLIDEEANRILTERYPSEFGVPTEEQVIPEATGLPSFPQFVEPGVSTRTTPEEIIPGVVPTPTKPSLAGQPIPNIMGQAKIDATNSTIRKGFVNALTPVKESNVDMLLGYFGENPEALRASFIGEGRNKQTENLARLLYPGITEQQLSDLFSIDALAVEQKAVEMAQKGGGGAWGTFTAGVGDLVANVGGIFRWTGADGIGQKLTRLGNYMQVQAEPIPFEPEGFTWEQLFNPKFWSTYGVRMLPTLMVLLIPGLGGYGLAAKGVKALNLVTKFGRFGKFAQAALSGLGGAALSRPLESALEAGNAYDMARQKGLSHEEADRAADEVFNKNMQLLGLDAVQFAVAFTPVGGSIGNAARIAVRKGLIKTAQIGGKMFITGLTEGGEEVYQEMVQKQALREKVDFSSPEMQLVFALGAAAGVGLGAAGDIIVRIDTKARTGLTSEQLGKLQDYKEEFVAEGNTEEVSIGLAWDRLLGEDEGLAKVVGQATQEVEKEIAQEQTKAKVAETTTPEVPAMVEGEVVSGKPRAIPSKAITEAEDLLTKIGEEWIAGRPGVGFTKNQIARAKAEVAKIAQRHGIDKGELWGNVWWEAEIKPEAIEVPLTEEQIEELIKSVSGKAGTTITPEVTKPTTETTALAEGETITGEVPEGEITVTGIAMSPAELSKIRQTIMVVGKTKGLSKPRLTEIFKEVVGRTPGNRQMPYGLTEMTDEQLLDTLEIIETARPMRVRAKIVIRPSTEKKIVSLKTSLIKEGKLTEDAFNSMVEQLKLPATRYESAQKFITEKEGRSLIRLMNDQAEVGLIQRQAEAAKALERNPTVKVAYDGYSKRIAKEGRVYFQGKPADVSILKDMRFAMEDLQVRTGKPFYDLYFALNRAKNANRIYFGEAKQRVIASTPQYNNLVNDKSSMKRIRDYIAAKNAWAKVKSPKDITPEEIKLANAYEKELFDLQPDFRYHRFLHHYQVTEGNIDKMQEKIPDAPKGDLREAINIYEGQGASKLKAYLNTKAWGIIKSGFEPLYVVNPNLAMRKLKAVFPTGRLEPRNIVSRDSVEFYPEDITLDKAVDRYISQIKSYNLQPYIRELERLYGESITQLKNPYKIRRGIGSMVNEMLGYKDRSFFGELVMKAASQAYITVFGTFPSLPFRNLFQNLAFHPDKSCLIDPRNRKLTDWEREFYETHVSQMKATARDLLLAEEAGLPGFRRLNRFILRLNIYGASDSKINRIWSFWGSLNKAERALKAYQADGNIDKFISSSGMAGLTLTQQKQILENLVMDEVTIAGLSPASGGQAAITEIANEVTNNVHFLYDRSQRAWVEMGEGGRLVGSLVVFPRSLLQRAIIQAKVLDPRGVALPFQKKRAMKILLAMLLGSLAANYLFAKSTGRKDAPYNPLNILKWSPGGLTVGALTTLTDVAGLIFRSASGDENALTQLPKAVESAGDTFIPFYKMTMQCLEAAVGKKYIDRHFYRQVRASVEKTLWEMGFLDKKEGGLYEPNDSFYEAERSGHWRIKHALFGTEPEEQIPGDKARKAQLNILAQFKYSRDWDDLTRDEKEAMYSEYPDLRES